VCDSLAMEGPSPFGDRRPGRLRRALIYFGLAADPNAEPDDEHRREAAPRREIARPAPMEPAAPEQARKERPALHQALVYFGLAGGEPPSRYGSEIPLALDRDIDALAQRVSELEDELRRLRAERPSG
jgi:hypothetical protein